MDVRSDCMNEVLFAVLMKKLGSALEAYLYSGERVLESSCVFWTGAVVSRERTLRIVKKFGEYSGTIRGTMFDVTPSSTPTIR